MAETARKRGRRTAAAALTTLALAAAPCWWARAPPPARVEISRRLRVVRGPVEGAGGKPRVIPEFMDVLEKGVHPRVPDVALIGFTKSGTASFRTLLKEHPNVAMQNIPELHRMDESPAKTQSNFALWMHEIINIRRAIPQEDQVVAIADPGAIWRTPASPCEPQEGCPDGKTEWPVSTIAEMFAHHMPNLTMVIFMRDPAARALSHYRHFWPGTYAEPSVRDYCLALPEVANISRQRTKQQEARKLPFCVEANIKAFITHAQICLDAAERDGTDPAYCAYLPIGSWDPEKRVITLGLYVFFLRTWTKVYGTTEHMVFADMTESGHDTERLRLTMADLEDGIGLPRYGKYAATAGKHYQQTKEERGGGHEPTPETVAALEDFYRPFVHMLVEEFPQTRTLNWTARYISPAGYANGTRAEVAAAPPVRSLRAAGSCPTCP